MAPPAAATTSSTRRRARSTFPDLDTWAFCVIRVELVSQKRVAKAEMKALFERLSATTRLFELDSWVHGLK